jgi:hypothetical protein
MAGAHLPASATSARFHLHFHFHLPLPLLHSISSIGIATTNNTTLQNHPPSIH